MKVYRNVYIKTNLPRFSGRELIYYTGRIVNNADTNGVLQKEFDRSQDLYLGCDCDAPRYSALIKKNEGIQIKENIHQKKSLISYGRKCKHC